LEMAGIGTIMTIASTAMGAVGTLAEMSSKAAQHKIQQQQLERQATEARAIGTQKAAERKREANLLFSNQIARAAASGGASDPSVVKLFGDTAAEGERNVQTELALAENTAQNYDYAAQAEAYSAKSAKTAGLVGFASSILGGGSSLYTKFGQRSTTQQSSYMYG